MSDLRKNLKDIPRIFRNRFTFENFGSKNGIIWPTCYTPATDTYKPSDGWEVVGFCEDPEIHSICGGPRPYAVMYECFQRIPKRFSDRGHEVGDQAWFHYRKLPKFTTLKGEPVKYERY